MKSLINMIGLLILALHPCAQQKLTPPSISETLYIEIQEHPQVKSLYIGCYGNKSSLYKKVDSLRQLVGQKSFENYFNTSSPILKYYSFLTILNADDIVAFEKLKSIIRDSSKIYYEFAGQNRGVADFNSLLAFKYLEFIKAKYYYGGRLTIGAESHSFPKKNIRTWKAKKSEFFNLMKENKVDTSLIKYYCR